MEEKGLGGGGDEVIVKKGPWTEQEDVKLVLFVNLFGDRRWDFIANVSGLKRTGKSCRLRWVNYLNPGLKRGKMTPHEERLLLHLHSQWGNRWSRIARKLPGRTDNEIKNYWRTHMRKKAQQQKQEKLLSSSFNSSASSSSSSDSPSTVEMESHPAIETEGSSSFFGAGGLLDPSTRFCCMDEIWKNIDFSADNSCGDLAEIQIPLTSSTDYDYCTIDSLWSMDEEEESKMRTAMTGDYSNNLPNTFNTFL